MITSKDFDFSFSGLKTAVLNITKSSDWKEENELSRSKLAGYQCSSCPNCDRAVNCSVLCKNKANLAYSVEAAIIDTLVQKTVKAAQTHGVEHIIVAGGVAANRKLVDSLQSIVNSNITIHVPPPVLCTDNGAMIAAAGFFTKTRINPLELQANPNLSLSK